VDRKLLHARTLRLRLERLDLGVGQVGDEAREEVIHGVEPRGIRDVTESSSVEITPAFASPFDLAATMWPGTAQSRAASSSILGP